MLTYKELNIGDFFAVKESYERTLKNNRALSRWTYMKISQTEVRGFGDLVESVRTLNEDCSVLNKELIKLELDLTGVIEFAKDNHENVHFRDIKANTFYVYFNNYLAKLMYKMNNTGNAGADYSIDFVKIAEAKVDEGARTRQTGGLLPIELIPEII